MQTALAPPPSHLANAGVCTERVRRVFSSWVQVIEGEEWTFTLKADGVHAKAPGRGEQSASYADVLAVLVKQRTFNLI